MPLERKRGPGQDPALTLIINNSNPLGKPRRAEPQAPQGPSAARIIVRLMREVEELCVENEYLWLALRIFGVEPESILHALPRDHWCRRSTPLQLKARPGFRHRAAQR